MTILIALLFCGLRKQDVHIHAPLETKDEFSKFVEASIVIIFDIFTCIILLAIKITALEPCYEV